MADDSQCQMVLWRRDEWRCEFWIETERGVLRLYRGDRLVRTMRGTGLAAYEQAKAWETAVSTHPDADPE